MEDTSHSFSNTQRCRVSTEETPVHLRQEGCLALVEAQQSGNLRSMYSPHTSSEALEDKRGDTHTHLPFRGNRAMDENKIGIAALHGAHAQAESAYHRRLREKKKRGGLWRHRTSQAVDCFCSCGKMDAFCEGHPSCLSLPRLHYLSARGLHNVCTYVHTIHSTYFVPHYCSARSLLRLKIPISDCLMIPCLVLRVRVAGQFR